MVNNVYFLDVKYSKKATSKVLGTRRLICGKFHTEEPLISGTTIQNLVTWDMWTSGLFIHQYNSMSVNIKMS
jgi:hypothetical protein